MKITDATKYELLLMNVERIPSHMFDNLGQHSIASYLETKGFKAMVYSGTTGDCEEIISGAIEKDSVPVIGFYTATDNLSVVKHLIEWIKKTYNVYTIAGGPEAVALKEDFLRETGCDFVIEGEGEIPEYQLLSCIIDNILPLEQVQSLRYIDKNNIYHENPLAKPFCNLDEIPFPSRKRCIGSDFRNKIDFGIITGRGCPFRCAFCYEGANTKKVRLRSIENVISEIDFAISENHKLKYLNIYDDTFTLDFRRVEAFCKEVKKRKLFWYCEGHTSNIAKNPEMVKIMVDSGMIGLQIGIESGSNTVLEAYNKKTDRDMILEVVNICKNAGLPRLVGNFIVGGAYETEESISESMKLAEQMLEAGQGMFECKTVFLAPYPHTPITLNPADYNLEYSGVDENTCIYSMQMPLMKPESMEYEKLISFKKTFDEMLKEKIRMLSRNAVKADVERIFFKAGERLNISSLWKDYYLKQEHIVNYIERIISIYRHGNNDYTDDELLELYPVRTFSLLEYKNGLLTYGSYIFSECESFLLKYSAGKIKFRDIIMMSENNKQDLLASYRSLNNRCLIYASRF
ncbi:MAG: B12-binding domain-containing radical SAM protein [Ruminococcus sp.]|nr:B12-binding domain-containing radical SAM protein [Ruminococcus sp.]